MSNPTHSDGKPLCGITVGPQKRTCPNAASYAITWNAEPDGGAVYVCEAHRYALRTDGYCTVTPLASSESSKPEAAKKVVERLREDARDTARMRGDDWSCEDTLSWEAADEIERLRSALAMAEGCSALAGIGVNAHAAVVQTAKQLAAQHLAAETEISSLRSALASCVHNNNSREEEIQLMQAQLSTVREQALEKDREISELHEIIKAALDDAQSWCERANRAEARSLSSPSK